MPNDRVDAQAAYREMERIRQAMERDQQRPDERVEAIRELANRNDFGVFIGQVALREFIAAYDAANARAERLERDNERLRGVLVSVNNMLNDKQFDVLMTWARRHDWLRAADAYRAALTAAADDDES